MLLEAWTPKTYQLVVVKSAQLMPLSFRNICYQHKEEILSGTLHPDDQAESAHTYDINSETGFLRTRIEELSRSIPRKIHDHAPFSEVCTDFGRLSHYVSDLNDPLLLSDSDTREPTYDQDFQVYLERNIDLFPWIFDGHEDPTLRSGQMDVYLYRIASAAGKSYPLLGNAYYPDGKFVSSDTFDPRSLPFGIASLSYSHSITNTVQLWFYVWSKSHGDTTYTPFLTKKNPRSSP